jgi:Fe-S cluster assembly iron-binding protein IscA
MGAFAEMIAECRDRFGGGKGNILRAESRQTGGVAPGEKVPAAMVPHYRDLLERGRVVWAAVAQVNRGMFSAGPDDLPGVTVYSLDAHYDDNPQDLCEVGRALYDLKGTAPVDPELKTAADRMTDEYDMTVRAPLPRKLADGRLIHVAGTIFHRGRLPGGVLRARLLPLVIAPEWTEANMILPLLCWPNELRSAWGGIDAEVAALPLGSTARRVAQSAPKRSLPEVALPLDGSPVRVTPEAARVFRQAVAQVPIKGPAYLCVGLRPDGSKYADVGESYDRTKERCFEEAGIRVVVRIDQIEQMRGAVVEFRDGLYGRGFVIRLAGE